MNRYWIEGHFAQREDAIVSEIMFAFAGKTVSPANGVVIENVDETIGYVRQSY